MSRPPLRTPRAHHEAAPLRLWILGPFRAEQAGEPIPKEAWQRRKTRALIRLLALEPLHRLHREQVQEIFWPELPDATAYSSFRKALHEARRALEPGLARGGASTYLHYSADVVALDPEVWIDADAFEEAARAALTAGTAAELEAALALYGGELLPDDRYEEWAASRREALAALHVQVVERLAAALEAEGQVAAAMARLQQAVTLDSTREPAHRGLMRLYAASGSTHQALRQYQICREALQAEVGVAPARATVALYEAIRAGRIGPGGATPDGPRPSGGAPLHGGWAIPTEEPFGTPLPLPPPLHHIAPTPFVGRRRALELLLDDPLLHPGTTAGPGERRATIFVSGEAGIGKTRLVGEAAREAHRHGAQVLWGTSDEHGARLPYGPFVEALGRAVAARAPRERAALARHPELRLFLPLLTPPTPEPATPEPAAPEPAAPEPMEVAPPPQAGLDQARLDQARLFAAVAQLLDEVASTAPLLLVLDDLHTADAASLALLHYLARLAPEHRWLLVATYREEEVAPSGEIGRLVAALRRSGAARQIDLRRLGEEESDRLVASLLPGGVADPAIGRHIYALSRGNPLFAAELAQDMRERGDLVLSGGRWTLAHGVPAAQPARSGGPGTGPRAVPRQVRELVEARLHGLGEETGRILDLAAVAGMESSFAVLAAAAAPAWPGATEAALLDALDRALEARLLEEHGDRYAFRHPLFRETLYARLTAARRARYHAALAAALAALDPAAVEALAHHWARAGDAEQAAAYLEQAGDRARGQAATKNAADYYAEAVRWLDELGRPAPVARVGEKLGTALTALARYAEALEVLERAARAYRQLGDGEGVLRTLAWIADAHADAGTPEVGIRRVQSVLEELETTDATPGRSELYAALSSLYFMAGRLAEQLAAAEQAVALARAVGDRRLVLRARLSQSRALIIAGRTAEALSVLQEAMHLAEDLDDTQSLSRALVNAAAIHNDRGELGRGSELLDRVLTVAERLGDPLLLIIVWGSRAIAAFLGGDWPRARSDGERALALSKQTGMTSARAHPLFYLGYLLLGEGDWREAAHLLDESIGVATSIGEVRMLRHATAARAWCDLLEGQPAAACDRLTAQLARAGTNEAGVSWLLIFLAWAHLDLGDDGEARDLARQAVAAARASEACLSLVDALWMQATVALRQRHLADAETALQEGLALARPMPYPFAEGRLLHVSALLHLERGEPGQARDRLHAALAIFERLGARKEYERSAAVLARLEGP